MPKGDAEDLFRKFSRGEKESSAPGVGLGLAICRAIVQAHGGDITATNRVPPLHGAVFEWTLPHRQAPSIAEPELFDTKVESSVDLAADSAADPAVAAV